MIGVIIGCGRTGTHPHHAARTIATKLLGEEKTTRFSADLATSHHIAAVTKDPTVRARLQVAVAS